MMTARAERYEFDAPFVELKDPAGHPHWFRTGQQVPDWVTEEQLDELIDNDDVFKFGRI